MADQQAAAILGLGVGIAFVFLVMAIIRTVYLAKIKRMVYDYLYGKNTNKLEQSIGAVPPVEKGVSVAERLRFEREEKAKQEAKLKKKAELEAQLKALEN